VQVSVTLELENFDLELDMMISAIVFPSVVGHIEMWNRRLKRLGLLWGLLGSLGIMILVLGATQVLLSGLNCLYLA
jgi:hypothetical protein